jgi:hypothetical protein
MNKTAKKIGDLRRMLSYINFKDRLSSDDYKRMDEIEAEINQLQASLKGTKGVAVKLTRNGSNSYSFYLTDDDVLCCGDEPTLFESEDEAQDYLDRARIVPSEYKIEFIEMTY